MLVRKVRNQNRVGKIRLSKTEVDLVCKLGLNIEEYVKQALIFVAQKRRWKWFFDKEQQNA